MIPKKIHYIWVGGNPMGEMMVKCIDSWKKFCPEFEIIEWNEKNFDVNQNEYCRQAFEQKKWAFVSDYMRLKVLHDHGGMYMDTDVEVIKPFDDFLFELPMFIGFEDSHRIQSGLIATEKNGVWVKKMLSHYDDAQFIKDDGTLDMTTNVIVMSRMTKEMYPDLEFNGVEQHMEHFHLYPIDYFCTGRSALRKKRKVTKNTYSIHHFSMTWRTDKEKFRMKVRFIIAAPVKFILGKRLTKRIRDRNNKKKINYQ